MAKKVRNIKAGGGRIAARGGVIANQLPTWNSVEDKLKVRDLIDRPTYYLKKIAKKFNISINDYDHLKDPLGIEHQNNKSFQNTQPNDDEKPFVHHDVARYHALLKGDIWGSMTEESKQYHNQYWGNFYRISYLEANGNEKVSRPVKYCYTSEEIQTIIDEDLVSGSSGYLVSKLGDISEPRWGPFQLQAKSKGNRESNIYIRPEYQSDPSFISGTLAGYDGSDDDYALYHLNYVKTGIESIATAVWGREERYDVTAEIGIQYKIYDLAVGDTVDPKRNYVIGQYTKRDDPEDQGYLLTGYYWEAPNQMVIPTKAYKNHVNMSMDVEFDRPLNINNTEQEVRVLNAKPVFKITRAKSRWIQPYGINKYSLIEQGVKDYNALYNFQYGAPFSFWGHKYDRFNIVCISDTDQLKSVRIHPGLKDSVEGVRRFKFMDCPNLEYMYFDPRCMPFLTEFSVSGCNLDFLNQMGPISDLSYLKNGVKNQPWRRRYKNPPAHSRCPYYNLTELDRDKDELYPKGCFPQFITNNHLSNVNLYGNRFNNTGIYAALYACYSNGQHNGYFNGKGQRNEGQDWISRAVFYTGVHKYPGLPKITGRYDPYQMNTYRQSTLNKIFTFEQGPGEDELIITSNGKYEEAFENFDGDKQHNALSEYLPIHGITNVPMYDINGATVQLAEYLTKVRGWIVELDYTDEPFYYKDGGSHSPNWAYFYAQNQRYVQVVENNFGNVYNHMESAGPEKKSDAWNVHPSEIFGHRKHEQLDPSEASSDLVINQVADKAKKIDWTDYPSYVPLDQDPFDTI